MEGSKQHQPDEVTTVDVIVEVDSLRAQELLRQNVPYSLEVRRGARHAVFACAHDRSVPMQGLDTERPMLTLGDVTLFGTFEQILGTEVVFDVTGAWAWRAVRRHVSPGRPRHREGRDRRQVQSEAAICGTVGVACMGCI